MGKFRSKLKRHSKGQRWVKGQSSTSNPSNMKHRLKAKSRFFQPNLSLAPPPEMKSANALTLEAVSNHEARLQYATDGKDPTVNDIAGSLRSFNFDGDEDMSESQPTGTFKTFQTFASNYSTCSNMSFKKLLNGFRSNSDQHKEMLAILTALTEIIKERDGRESSTSYFLLLMETIEACAGDSETTAAISLLAMGIKSVPIPVLRKQFSETARVLMEMLERYMNTENQTVIKYLIGCLSVLLRAQDFSTWSYSSTTRNIDAILTFTIHSKPKIRKAAQHAVVAIIHGSSFMEQPKHDENGESNGIEVEKPPTKIIYHPAGERVAKFCLNQFKIDNIKTSQTTVLHTLTLLKDTISGFKTDDIRIVCESLLSIMTAPNILIRTNCLHTLHSLFQSKQSHLNGILCGKLISAIYDYRPDKTDVRQTLAWLTVLKQAHIHLVNIDLKICMNSLPKFIDICTELWVSTDRKEIVTGVSNTIKEIMLDCVKSACATEVLANQYRSQITKIINLLGKPLLEPFTDAVKYIIITFSNVFEITGEYFSDVLLQHLSILGSRYDANSVLCVHIEHAVIAAIKSMGPENVIKAIPITNQQNEIVVEKSWLLPLLREGTYKATFNFFANFILVHALECNKRWRKYTDEGNHSLSHTNELLCCQLWGLLPGFCRNPKDPENFKLIAKTLGIAVVENVEFRAPILDGITELIKNSDDNVHIELAKYAKNFLPRLFNVYTTKPNGSYESELRKKTLDVIKLFLTITNNDILSELFEKANKQLISVPPGSFECDAILDINNALLLYQNFESIKHFYDLYIIPIMKNEKSKFIAKDEQKLRKQQRKVYELLTEILRSDRNNCKKFAKRNANDIEKVLFETLTTTCLVCQASRLRCLKYLIDIRKNLTIKDQLITKTIPEVVVTFRDFSTKKESIALDLITLIGELYQKNECLNDFVNIILAGFGGDQILSTNTILTLRAIVHNLTGNLTVNTLDFILKQVLIHLSKKSRQECEAAVIFLITFIKVLPTALVANHVESIMKALSSMVPDTKRYCRLHLGYLIKKLCKRFTADELIKFVPGDDEVTHRRLKKIRKMLRRETRKKINEEEVDDDYSDDDLMKDLEKRSTTIDDILADTDSDLSDNEETEKGSSANKNTKKSSKKKDTYIQEAPEEIVDLADLKSIGNVLTNRPNANIKETKKNKDSNRGFKTAEDGRLIISDKFIDSDSDDSDENNDMDTNTDGGKKLTKRGMDEDSSDEEQIKGPSAKRKALSFGSVKSGASRYTAGGKGIHRPVAASVKSGYSGISKMSSATTKSMGGTEYKAKKAKGDMKKNGKLDPYAYIPLSRNILNKRKRSKNAGQYKSIVNGTKKGPLKGSKNRVQKTYKK